MSDQAPDIRRPEAIDAAWLTRALQTSGVDAVVSDFTAAPVGTGQIGDSVRFRLRYARGGDDVQPAGGDEPGGVRRGFGGRRLVAPDE